MNRELRPLIFAPKLSIANHNAPGAILYDTSNIVRNFPESRHVGVALQPSSSVALMFWYIFRIFTSRD